MKNLLRHLALSLCLLSVGLVGCRRDLSTARGVVEEFVDQHYVNIDLEKAKQYTAGLALAKIDEERRLTAGQVVDASTRKPTIHYRLLEKKESARRASFLYEGTIRAEDAPVFTRRWLILARREGDRWWVSNFSEYD
ncbi:MAG: hypothetical protein HYY46_17365 [Deltaproteobacteria bacterium]|nr:hypothetical protein [Deltaproteobacteria bacterium]